MIRKELAARAIARRKPHAARSASASATSTPNIVAQSEKMQAVLAMVERVAPTNSTVLLGGESGVGKDLIARAIHEHSHRDFRAIRQNQQHRHPGKFAGERTLRLRKGRVHRRHDEQAGKIRVGGQRHAFPGRNRRRSSGHAGEAAARAARKANSSAWAERRRSKWTCAWLPPRIATCARRSKRAPFAKIFITGSTSWPSIFRRCASTRKIFPRLCNSFLEKFAQRVRRTAQIASRRRP